MPILIVEGSNKVGKSTLIEAIRQVCEYKGFPYYIMKRRVAKNDKSDVTPEQMYEVALEDLKEALLHEAKGELVIFDRFHISEFVYGYTYRNYFNTYMLKVNKILKCIGAKIIFVKSGYDHIENVEDRLKFERIQEYFESFIEEFKEDCEIKETSIVTNESLYLKEKAEEILKCL